MGERHVSYPSEPEEDVVTVTAPGPETHPFEHPALFYRDQDDYLAATIPFIADGLTDGEPMLVAVPEPNLKLVRDALGNDAAEVTFIDMSVAGRNPGRIIGEVLLPFAEKHHPQRVRIIGEPIWLGRTSTEYPACAQHEALINVAFAGRRATILCPYHLDSLHPRVIDDAKRTHPIMWLDDRRSVSSRYGDPIAAAESFNIALPPPPPMAATMLVADLNLAAVRGFTAAQASALGLRDERLPDAVLAVNELASNTFRHAGGAGKLAAWAERDQVIFELTDDGHIEDPLAGRRPAPLDQMGGRGLLFVHQLCDLVRVHSQPGGTTVRIYFDRRGRHRHG
jgi:anti-sigma regulatory factor (Ser/Thr protein kinase)